MFDKCKTKVIYVAINASAAPTFEEDAFEFLLVICNNRNLKTGFDLLSAGKYFCSCNE
jgi:hypothetical protein